MWYLQLERSVTSGLIGCVMACTTILPLLSPCANASELSRLPPPPDSVTRLPPPPPETQSFPPPPISFFGPANGSKLQGRRLASENSSSASIESTREVSAAEFAVTSPGEEAGRKAQVKPSDNVLQRPVHNPGPAPPKADQNLTPPAKSKAPKQGDDKPSKPKKESDKQGPLGDAPRSVDDLFVSQSAILLKPGETQIDVGFVYSWQDAQGVVLRAVPGGTVVTTDRRRARRFLVPTNIRHGFTENLELFFSAPFGFSQFERSDPFQLFEDSQGGISDISAGFQYQLQKQTDKKPDITATFRVTAPTGSGSATIQGANLNLGRGFWGLQGELNFIKTYDPIVLFSRVGYRHEFAGERFNLSVQPGETFNYSFGMGFAISDQIAVNAAVNGQFQGRTILAGRSVPNSSTEPISMLFSLTRRTSKMTRVQPFIEFGLTDDAADATFGIVFIRNFEPLCGIAK